MEFKEFIDQEKAKIGARTHPVEASELERVLLADAIFELAKAINRLAATQEKPVVSSNRGAVHFSVANPEDQPDAQTAELREIERKRTKEG